MGVLPHPWGKTPIPWGKTPRVGVLPHTIKKIPKIATILKGFNTLTTKNTNKLNIKHTAYIFSLHCALFIG